jgi:FtsP/CotA-like multicopper oxidase with cupredoxin domain
MLIEPCVCCPSYCWDGRRQQVDTHHFGSDKISTHPTTHLRSPDCSLRLLKELEMHDTKKVGRRRLLSLAGLTGAGVVLGKRTARAESADKPHESWPSGFQAAATAPRWHPRDLPKAGEKIHEFDLELVLTKHEILPRIEHHAYAYNGTVPGPEIRVKEGDWVKVNFTNKTHDFHTIHWHGMMVPNEMDGVPLGTQYPVGFGQTFQYLFRAQPAGTHFYHCHNMTPLHVQVGMYGPLIIESAGEDLIRKSFPYEREYTLVLSEIDTNMVRDQLNDMQRMGQVMDYMNDSPKLMAKMSGRMMGWFANKEAFLKAIKEGWVPPYDPSKTGMPHRPEPNFFMINGKSYPMTEPLMIRRGENLRVRLINAGAMPHFMHLHGHDFWQVCQDGAPLASPLRLNTVPVFPGGTTDIVIQGTNPGMWHFHDHSDLATTNNGMFPGGMMTMLMYEDAEEAGVKVMDIIAVNS